MLSSHCRRFIQRFQQFLLAYGGGAALHYYDASCVVCQVRGLFGGCACSEGGGESCNHGVAGAGNVGYFIAAVNWNLDRLVAARENDHAILAAGDEQRFQIHFACDLISGGQKTLSAVTDADAKNLFHL